MYTRPIYVQVKLMYVFSGLMYVCARLIYAYVRFTYVYEVREEALRGFDWRPVRPQQPVYLEWGRARVRRALVAPARGATRSMPAGVCLVNHKP